MDARRPPAAMRPGASVAVAMRLGTRRGRSGSAPERRGTVSAGGFAAWMRPAATDPRVKCRSCGEALSGGAGPGAGAG
ncbi:hypothetical protein GCM10010365_53170 [Streptomyces poonensis]|uniref:Uncharacterized protein n=1 Tax=Streptomyces poonensis TaxID=68255 RepID=A0A918PX01_9ACTN|nr:hypothetical protein GCM10010365_53170 [Streptomyces poonensis]GLJ89019.1 hypothetical protein GCM10017589_16190 [Streptomyces poonensis]